jgi:transposase InsO family protein
MTQAGLAGVYRRRFVTTTVKDGGRQAPGLVERNFTAEAPDRLWVADITYIPTWAGFLYLAVVLDAFSRRIVGWSMATTLAKQLVLDALNMALATRRPRDVIHHSDQGSQYTSNRLRPPLPRCRRAPLYGLSRRRLRQRHVREFLRKARMRAARSVSVQDTGRSASCGVRIHRGLLQSAPPPLIDRISLTDRL